MPSNPIDGVKKEARKVKDPFLYPEIKTYNPKTELEKGGIY